MASSLVLRKLAAAANLRSKTLMLVRPAALSRSASRLLNTSAARETDSDSDESDFVSERRSSLIRRFFPGPYYPFPWAARGFDSGVLFSNRSGFDVKETDDSLNFRIEMPGLGKEDVRISVEQDTVTIKGEEAKESEDEEDRKYTRFLVLTEMKDFKLKEIKAEMKNGVLKLVVPKVKEEDAQDGEFQVKVE